MFEAESAYPQVRLRRSGIVLSVCNDMSLLRSLVVFVHNRATNISLLRSDFFTTHSIGQTEKCRMGVMENGRTIRIGCQSWSYDDWVTKAGGETVFYPRGTKPAEMLPLYSQVLDTIEVDSTAYGVPQISAVEGWYEKTPESFVFSLKVPRAMTHEFSLRPGCYPIIESFVAAARHLKQKLGVILVQLPASFEATKENAQSVRDFLAQLPRDVKFAVEFRNSGWFVDWTFEEFASSAIPLAGRRQMGEPRTDVRRRRKIHRRFRLRPFHGNPRP